MKLCGIEAVIVTNAAGSLNPSFGVGDIMMIKGPKSIENVLDLSFCSLKLFTFWLQFRNCVLKGNGNMRAMGLEKCGNKGNEK